MLNQIRYALARQVELRKLAAPHPVPSAPELVRNDAFTAVWRVLVPGQADRFMSARSGAINGEVFFVHLDAEAFYRAWLQSSPALRGRRSCDCVIRAAMPNDYKYRHAVAGFSHGVENPVPLAEVGAHQAGRRLHIGFINGVTRTFWLLANRCPAFPAKVYGEDSARLLNQVAGLLPAPPPFADLFPPRPATSAPPSGPTFMPAPAGRARTPSPRPERLQHRQFRRWGPPAVLHRQK